jgi:aryl-alcohol dehydrogenase-like predicted oxidoreductase
MAAISLAWLKNRPGVTSVLIGARNLEQLQANLAALDLEVQADTLAELDDASRPAPMYPGWMVATQSGR